MTYKFPGTPAETKVAEFLVASTGGHFVTIVRPVVGELLGVSIRGETVVIRDLMAALSTDAEPVSMHDEDRTPMPAGFDDALWRKADEVHHAMALVARDQECVKIIYAALSTHNAEQGTVLKNAIRAVSEAFDPSSMLPITENQAQGRAIGSLNRLSALYAEPHDAEGRN